MKTGFRSLFLSALCGVLVSTGLLAAVPSAETPDESLKILKKGHVSFPQRMLAEGILRGEANLVFYVDSKGQMTDSLVVAYSKEEFARVAKESLKDWVFQAGRKNGAPCGTVVNVTFVFETNGVVVVDKKPGAASNEEEWGYFKKYAYAPCDPAKLDHPLKGVEQTPPDYPKALREKGVVGRVLVSFYVDEKGNARLPIALSSENPMLANMAVAAVEQWKFAPPTSAGNPVIVRAQQEFCFVTPK